MSETVKIFYTHVTSLLYQKNVIKIEHDFRAIIRKKLWAIIVKKILVFLNGHNTNEYMNIHVQ